MDNHEKHYQRAKERVQEIKAFYSHVFIYLIVNLGLFVLNFIVSRGSWWFYWPLLGWGVGLIAHAFSVFGLGGVLGHQWEEKKINEMMNKMEKKDIGKEISEEEQSVEQEEHSDSES